jgi:polar amino acid transport system substrate-binding protein
MPYLRPVHPRRRLGRRLAGLLLVAVAAASGCSTTDPPAAPARPSLGPPLPVGVHDPAVLVSTAAPPANDCNALASPRPLKTLPTPGHMPAGSTMEKIFKRGRLIIGTDQNSYLFGFRDPASGRIVGFDVDIARQIARAIFGVDDDQHVQFVALASDERVDAASTRKVDLVAQTMTINCDRRQHVAFSAEYYEAAQKILVSSSSDITGLADLGSRRVCAATGSTNISNIKVLAPTAHIVSVKYWTDCLVLLQQGQAEAITCDDTILSALAAQDPTVKLVGKGLSSEPYGLAMSKSATDLVRFVNGVLERMRQDGTWKRIYQTWLGSPAPEPPAPLYSN